MIYKYLEARQGADDSHKCCVRAVAAGTVPVGFSYSVSENLRGLQLRTHPRTEV